MSIEKKGNNVFEKDPFNMKQALDELKREIKKPFDVKQTGHIYSLMRASLGLTQHEFAEILSLRVKTISRWENNETYPVLTADQFHILTYELKKIGVDTLNIKCIRLLVDTHDLKIINSFAFSLA